MSEKQSWGCPLCYIPGIQGKMVPMGETCPNIETCDQPLNVNGMARRINANTQAIGIGAISPDEQEGIT